MATTRTLRDFIRARRDELAEALHPGALRSKSRLQTRTMLAIAALALVYAIGICWALRHSRLLTPDAVDYAATARSMLSGEGYQLPIVHYHAGLLSRISRPPEMHGLLRPFELAPIFALFGIKESLVRLPSVFYVAGTAAVVGCLGVRLASPLCGWLAFLLLLTRTEMALVAVLGVDDVGAAFWSLLTVVFAHAMFKTKLNVWALLTGVAAALGTLEKLSGILLPSVLSCVAMLMRPQTHFTARRLILVLAPSVFVVGIYVLRNMFVHGSVAFRFSALEWSSKNDLSNYFAYYEVVPTLRGAWAHLGWPAAIRVIGRELTGLWQLVLADWPIRLLGPILLLFFPSYRIVAVAILVYGFGLLLVTGSAHHIEIRYLSGVLPFFVLAVACLPHVIAGRLGSARPLLRSIVNYVCVTVLAVFLVAPAAVTLAFQAPVFARTLAQTPRCAESMAFLRAQASPRAAVLTSDPWLVHWETGLPTIMTPTNGSAALSKIIGHYRPHYALTSLSVPGGAELELSPLQRLREFRFRVIYDGAECDVIQIGYTQ